MTERDLSHLIATAGTVLPPVMPGMIADAVDQLRAATPAQETTRESFARVAGELMGKAIRVRGDDMLTHPERYVRATHRVRVRRKRYYTCPIDGTPVDVLGAICSWECRQREKDAIGALLARYAIEEHGQPPELAPAFAMRMTGEQQRGFDAWLDREYGGEKPAIRQIGSMPPYRRYTYVAERWPRLRMQNIREVRRRRLVRTKFRMPVR